MHRSLIKKIVAAPVELVAILYLRTGKRIREIYEKQLGDRVIAFIKEKKYRQVRSDINTVAKGDCKSLINNCIYQKYLFFFVSFSVCSEFPYHALAITGVQYEECY